MDFLILPGWRLLDKKYSRLTNLLEKKGHRAYVVNFPGFSTEKLLQPLTLNDYVEYVLISIRKQRISRPVIIGHSFGGRVALRLSRLHPEIPRMLILTGTPGYRSDSPFKIHVFRFLAKTGKSVLGKLLSGGLLELLTKGLYRLSGNYDYYRADPILKQTFENIIHDSLVSDMKRVTAKTLLIWGADDTITPLWIGEKMKNTIQNSSLHVIKNADHGVVYKHPDTFIELLDTILK
ncbi:alpha/beta hydrolase [Candidatus Roizmanbacteria bacterium]|nr:alpha/beta hydrolase [Candidatus Roizmanbacteria bacterium]